jgi:hypothetical protein
MWRDRPALAANDVLTPWRRDLGGPGPPPSDWRLKHSVELASSRMPAVPDALRTDFPGIAHDLWESALLLVLAIAAAALEAA